MLKRILSFCLILLAYNAAFAQLSYKNIGSLFGNASAETTLETPVANDSTVVSDSARWESLILELDQARLNEANLRMEIEEMRLADLKADSVRRYEQQRRIDSLRITTKGACVVVGNDTLFYLYAKDGGRTPEYRAKAASEVIERIGKTLNLQPDSVYVETSDIVTDVMYGSDVIVSFSDRDGLWAGCSRDSLAFSTRQVIVAKLQDIKQDHRMWKFIKRIISAVLVLIFIYLLFRCIKWGFKKLDTYIEGLKETKLKPFFFQEVELLSTHKQVKLLLIASKLVRYFVMLLVLILTVPILFSLFPQTKSLALKIFSYIWNPILNILKGIVAYIPNLFTIVVICIAIQYLIKFFRYLATEIESGRLHIKGFYSDWAMPTFFIIRFLLYAFMIAMIYPYLPGANSGIFQGISVFLGLIVSLGSSTIIGNIIAGFVITYMRPFKLGDRISLGETTGNVIEKTTLVTRIKTPKNEVVTIPNSFIMSSQTVNFSQSAREFGLIIHTEVTIGYDAPWRQVHELLINAALNTPGVIDDPKPFVLETSLHDYYPVYQLNAYIRNADELGQIYSNLHETIQDIFNKAGIEIMSPQYIATRDGSEITIPKEKK